ncbi:CheR family methyltransferase [Sporosarcina highlanderae]
MDELEQLEIQLFLQGIYEWYGYDFRDYAYNSIRRRIWHRVYEERLNSILGLMEKTLRDSECLKRLLLDFSINVTEMFRDPSFFLAIREKIIPHLRTYPSLRIWHAGCATGEEVYSMAILLQEEGLYDKAKIYATDINEKALGIARRGQYPLEVMKKYTNNYLKAGGAHAFSEYYSVSGNVAKFDSSLSKNIIFAEHNLVTDQSFNEFHLILCRNVMIYFNKTLKEKVYQLFHESLTPFGFLCLGDKESIMSKEYYQAISSAQKIYQKH